jgi:putative flippase GtrA
VLGFRHGLLPRNLPLLSVRNLSSKHLALFSRYSIVGIANTLVYGVLLYLFLTASVIPNWASVSCAFALAMVFQYFANRIFTFRSRSSSPVRTQFSKYILVATLNYGLTLFIVETLTGGDAFSKLIASSVAAVVTAFVGYVLSAYWVYR